MGNKIKADWSNINSDTLMPNVDEIDMTEEEKVWHRLKNGVARKTLAQELAENMAKEIQIEIDKEIMNSLVETVNNKLAIEKMAKTIDVKLENLYTDNNLNKQDSEDGSDS